MPRAGRTASAAATSMGATLAAPSVNDGRLSALCQWRSLGSALSSDFPLGQARPILAAVRTTLHRPTFCSREANHTLVENRVPVQRAECPPFSLAPLCTFRRGEGSPLHVL